MQRDPPGLVAEGPTTFAGRQGNCAGRDSCQFGVPIYVAAGSATYHRTVQHEGELYGERKRRIDQDERLAAGLAQLTDQLDQRARVKLMKAWDDILGHVAFRNAAYNLEDLIRDRTLGSEAIAVRPDDMEPGRTRSQASNDQLLSLIEAEHEALRLLVEKPAIGVPGYPGMSPQWLDIINAAPEKFRTKVNAVLTAHLVELQLHENSRLVPVRSQAMHAEVVAPALHLLHGQPRFVAAENAYQDALRELRNGDANDAITDAGAALQNTLEALGCTGNTLGQLLRSARDIGVLRAADERFTTMLSQTIAWVKDMRNAGEAHSGDADYAMSDAWMAVQLVGALILRLADTDRRSET